MLLPLHLLLPLLLFLPAAGARRLRSKRGIAKATVEEIRRALGELTTQVSLKKAATRKRGSQVSQAIKRAMWQQEQREAAEKRKADNRSKVLLGVVAISLAQQDNDLRARIDAEARHLYALSPGRLKAALEGLELTVVKPESEQWNENV